MSKPNSLVSRVFKARYYPNTNFLEARMGDNPSYIWRSIMEAQGLVTAGIRWRVGSGESIGVLRQPWLVESDNPYIISVSPSLNNASVASLIDMNCREWDQDILKDLFNDRDQLCINKVVVGEKESCDEVYWCKENHGITLFVVHTVCCRVKNITGERRTTTAFGGRFGASGRLQKY